MSTYTLDEGTCQRCGKTVTRRPGSRWTDFYGRDRCRLEPGDGECDVREWHQIQLPQSPPLQLATVTLFGRNAAGQPVVLLEQQVPAGMSYAEELVTPLEVTGWSITADAAPSQEKET